MKIVSGLITCLETFRRDNRGVALTEYIVLLGVMIGGLVWSWMYMRYRSIWPGWVSHAIVDVAVFGVGAWVLFGAG